jgi:hypothetical protein
MHSTDGGKYLLCNQPSFGVDCKQLCFVLGIEGYAYADGDNDTRDDAYGNQCELPLDNKCDNKRRNECRHSLYCESELLRDTIIDIVAVGSGLDCDRSCRVGIKVSNVLPQNVFDEVDTKRLRCADGRDGYQDLGLISMAGLDRDASGRVMYRVCVNECEFGYKQIQEVQPVTRFNKGLCEVFLVIHTCIC